MILKTGEGQRLGKSDDPLPSGCWWMIGLAAGMAVVGAFVAGLVMRPMISEWLR